MNKDILRRLKGVLSVLLCTGLVLSLYSCKEDEAGRPVITNVRITDPSLADSTLTGGKFGQLVVIQGVNLGSVRKVFFNTEEAYITPTFVTDQNIILPIPNSFPSEITNKIRVVTEGGEATYDFDVEIPLPVVSALSNEFAPDGSTISIIGNYFYNVSEVIFPGGKTAEIVEVKPEVLTVKVPQGAAKGNIKIVTNAGEMSSPIVFRDDKGIIMNFDDKGKCWGNATVVESSASPEIAPVSGNYARIKAETVKESSYWDEALLIASCGPAGVSGGSVSDYVLKFEINVPEKWERGWFELNFDGGNYHYKPWETGKDEVTPFSTAGWTTITIPLSEFKKDEKPINDLSSLSNFRFGSFQNGEGGEVSNLDVSIDNLRIVKK